MNANLLHEACSAVDQDLSPEWLELCRETRDLANELAARGDDETAARMAEKATLLCQHVERMHGDVSDLITRLESEASFSETDANRPLSKVDESEIDREAVKQQRETHEGTDVLDVVKALFMWRDDPEDRLREKRGEPTGLG